ncbi:tRNA dihydrouridine(16) synthase DusC [Psychromonas aquimarina]|uniref:tRNA dihydrouridine(16) synthase DusC n=1 Tax=Psychromonas aquimarina TaxID=444919 RepID=UPI00040A45B0|nr:tRNA dihydrouridine(16) synthase DusC [Psychromonas aquimarina]
MRVILAPMEGVADAFMRNLLTDIGGYDMCVSEFIRIVDQLLPRKVFRRMCPELHNGSKTEAGVPVRVQLLGQDPDWMAENAYRAVSMGSQGLDLNFGCPARTVNKNLGGASLLKEPELIYQIVKEVRGAVPDDQILSAKIRLGWDCKSRCVEIAQAIRDAGAKELTVHARTKEEGYKPPAHWQYIKLIKDCIDIPVIANGEIWSRTDYIKCKEISGCEDVMIGRGAVAVPNLARVLKGETKMPWHEVTQQLLKYSDFETTGSKERYYPQRIKQWLRYIAMQYSEGEDLFVKVRSIKSTSDIIKVLSAENA